MPLHFGKKLNSKRGILRSLALASYLYCVMLGQFTHSVVHHIHEIHHHHSLECFSEVLNENPKDENSTSRIAQTSFQPADCNFKLALHQTVGQKLTSDPSFTALATADCFKSVFIPFESQKLNHLFLFLSNGSPRGPPTLPLS